MNVSLSPELETLVAEKVKSGNYNSASEVIREGLRLIQERDEIRKIRREAIRQEVMKGFEEIRRGEGIVYNSADELAEAVIEHNKKGRK